MNIQDIVLELKMELENGQDWQSISNELADDYGVKVEAILVRFEKAYGVHPSEYVNNEPSKEDKIQQAVAKQSARHPIQATELVGKRFFIRSSWWRFVALHNQSVFCVCEETLQQEEIWGGDTVQLVLKQINQ